MLLKIRKAHYIVSKIFPFVTVQDIADIVESLKENPEIKMDDWTAQEIAEIVSDIVGDM